jgi:hypothetical protein
VLVAQHQAGLQDRQHAQREEVTGECAWEVGVLSGEAHYKLAREASEHVWRGHVLYNTTVSDW